MRATERGQDQLTNNEPAGGVDPLGEDFLSHHDIQPRDRTCESAPMFSPASPASAGLFFSSRMPMALPINGCVRLRPVTFPPRCWSAVLRDSRQHGLHR